MMGRCEGGQGVGQGRGGPLRMLPGAAGGWPVTLILLALLQTGRWCFNLYIVEHVHSSEKKRNFYGQIPATLMPIVDRNNYGG